MKDNKYSRRNFISTSVKGMAVLSAAGVVNSCSLLSNKTQTQIPHRILGKTGLSVSILSFGGGSQFLRNKNGDWEKTLEKAIDSGINLFDTSPDYVIASRDGKIELTSEERFGEFLPAVREKVHIISKFNEREAGLCRKSVEQSLKKMKTDYLDILLIHSVNDDDSVSSIENGVYKDMIQMKNEGIVRHIGFSSMDSAQRSKDLLENLDFDATILALNPTKWGDYPGLAFPAARKKDVGIIAMKVFRSIVGDVASPKELLEYAWEENNVASAVIGHYGIETLEENINLAIDYGKESLVQLDKTELESRLASYSGPHALVWARPGYKDGGIIV